MGVRLELNHTNTAFALCSFKTYDGFDLLLVVYYSWRFLIKLTQFDLILAKWPGTPGMLLAPLISPCG